MKPESTPTDDLLLFQAHFDQLLNLRHPLIKLARQIDWDTFDQQFGELYCPDHGAPAKSPRSSRLMVGLHYLKHTFNKSDQSVVAKWVENPFPGVAGVLRLHAHAARMPDPSHEHDTLATTHRSGRV